MKAHSHHTLLISPGLSDEETEVDKENDIFTKGWRHREQYFISNSWSFYSYLQQNFNSLVFFFLLLFFVINILW